jgi:hypothetical protein
MDASKSIKKLKNNHPTEMSCLKKCLKWSITINTQGQKFNNQAYYGDYLHSSNQELYTNNSFIDILPIDISKAQLLAIDKGIDNRLKFNIEFDLSGIRTPFKSIEPNYSNQHFDLAINVN